MRRRRWEVDRFSYMVGVVLEAEWWRLVLFSLKSGRGTSPPAGETRWLRMGLPNVLYGVSPKPILRIGRGSRDSKSRGLYHEKRWRWMGEQITGRIKA